MHAGADKCSALCSTAELKAGGCNTSLTRYFDTFGSPGPTVPVHLTSRTGPTTALTRMLRYRQWLLLDLRSSCDSVTRSSASFLSSLSSSSVSTSPFLFLALRCSACPAGCAGGSAGPAAAAGGAGGGAG